MSDSTSLDAARQIMLERHLRGRGIRSREVLQAMARVPREQFIPPAERKAAYDDRALAIDCGQTISQPYIVALMTESLELTGRQRVLDVGTGSGYQTAVLAELAQEVVSVERHEPLSRRAGEILQQLGYENVRLVVGDGTQGFAEAAPYDGILVAAAAPQCPPALFEQLAEGGRLVIPLGPTDQQVLTLLRKVNGQVEQTSLTGCRFVPLVEGAE